MKKVIIVLLAVFMVFAFVGCKKDPIGEVLVKDPHIRLVGDYSEHSYLFEFVADKDYGAVEYGCAMKCQNPQTKEWSYGEVQNYTGHDLYYEFIHPSGHPTQPAVAFGRLYMGDRVRFVADKERRDQGRYYPEYEIITLYQIVIRSVDNPENSYTYTFE